MTSMDTASEPSTGYFAAFKTASKTKSRFALAKRDVIVLSILGLTCCITNLLLHYPSVVADSSQLGSRISAKLQGGAGPDPLLASVRNSTLGFQKVYGIVGASRTDRIDTLRLAAANTGIDFDLFDGVDGHSILDKVLPPHNPKEAELTVGEKGCWRAHLNVYSDMIANNITSALILEGDADWDVRLKDQLVDFAKASRALLQPRIQSPQREDPLASDQESDFLDFRNLPLTKGPTSSPYGDGWDILAIGHCGTRSPVVDADPRWKETNAALPKLHVVQNDDPTVVEPHYRKSWSTIYQPPPFKTLQPDANHTRIYHHPLDMFCTHGYAISLEGAKRLTWFTGVRGLDNPMDVAMSRYCDTPSLEGSRGPCIIVQPPLLYQHRLAGGAERDSEVGHLEDGAKAAVRGTRGYTFNIRQSVQVNLPNLLFGWPLVDQWPDTHVG